MKTILAIAALAVSATAANASGLVPGSDTYERASDARSVHAVATDAYGDRAATVPVEAPVAAATGASVVPGIDNER